MAGGDIGHFFLIEIKNSGKTGTTKGKPCGCWIVAFLKVSQKKMISHPVRQCRGLKNFRTKKARVRIKKICNEFSIMYKSTALVILFFV
jgi:hypothetical protein